MSISVFPVAVPVTSSINANALTAASANILYEGTATFDPAIYQVTCAAGTITNFQFLSNAGTIITTGVTASGTVSINLASTADRIRVWTNTGSNIVITITKTASSLTNAFSGTLDTITSTSTYTGTSTSGYGYAVVVGGGGGGGAASNNTQQSAHGGGSAAVVGKLAQLTGSMSVVIGSAGLGSNNPNSLGGTGGTTTFAGATSNGGNGGGLYSVGAGSGGNGSGGDIVANGAGGGGGGQNRQASANGISWNFVINGSTGGGSYGGVNSFYTGLGGGAGIGTGGNTGNSNSPGGAATGYGAGGGGASGKYGQANGGSGSPGVVYVLKF